MGAAKLMFSAVLLASRAGAAGGARGDTGNFGIAEAQRLEAVGQIRVDDPGDLAEIRAYVPVIETAQADPGDLETTAAPKAAKKAKAAKDPKGAI
jgi:hypothetical protein